MSGSYSTSTRLREERIKIGLTQAELADRLGVTKWTIINYEKEVGRATSIPADTLELCVALGMDIQYIITGIRSKNLDRVAEEAESYDVGPQGVGAISREEQKILEMYRKLKPPERTRLRAIVDWLVSAKVKKDETGSG